jgi:rfaE bifunctional protein nucleotidyltransferase chain/domain
MIEKIKEREQLRSVLEGLRSQGKRIVFTNGCFDLLHVGHIRYLEKARSLGDLLVVGLNSDRSVRELKGPLRPILPQEERAEILSGLGCVDLVTFFDEPDPFALIATIRPQVLVKGGDWTVDRIVGREIVEASGGTVVSVPFEAGHSTSSLVETILERYGKRD